MVCLSAGGQVRCEGFVREGKHCRRSPVSARCCWDAPPVKVGLDVPEEVEGQLLGFSLAADLALVMLCRPERVSKGDLQHEEALAILLRYSRHCDPAALERRRLAAAALRKAEGNLMCCSNQVHLHVPADQALPALRLQVRHPEPALQVPACRPQQEGRCLPAKAREASNSRDVVQTGIVADLRMKSLAVVVSASCRRMSPCKVVSDMVSDHHSKARPTFSLFFLMCFST